MSKLIRWALVLLVLILSCTSFGCGPKKSDSEDAPTAYGKQVTWDTLELSEYVELPSYEGRTVAVEEGISRGDAIFSLIVKEANVLRYPEEQVIYYFEQEQGRYRYHAAKIGISYEELLTSEGLDEERLMEEAKRQTKRDMVFYALADALEVEITSADRESHYEKYVEKFVESYGYTEKYVRDHMSEEILESMRYDKLLEKLISLNSFS